MHLNRAVKELLSLGLDPSTADMYYIQMIDEDGCYYEAHVWVAETAEEKLQCEAYKTSAWSLAALLELMPIYIRTNNGDYNFSLVRGDVGAYTFSYTHGLKEPWELGYNLHLTTHENSVIDAAFEMVCWLIKQGHIKANR